MSIDSFTYSNELTMISRSLYNAASDSSMTLNQAVAYLKENSQLRTLRESILKYAPEKDSPAFRKKITRAMQQIHPESAPDTIRRRVNDWMNTPERTIDKTSAIELCFALQLSFEKANRFLAEVTEEGFHYRDPYELIYIFALNHGMSYSEAEEMHRRIDHLSFNDPSTNQIVADTMTRNILSDVSMLNTPDELIDYIHDARLRLGRMHQTAYQMFIEMLNQLQSPEHSDSYDTDSEMHDRRLSVSDVLSIYLHRQDIPRSKRNASLSPLHRAMLSQWPSEKEISQMKQRVIDVNRKTLLLLYLATEDFSASEDDYYDSLYEDEDDCLPDDRDADFRTALNLANTMLSECGWCPLDPRRPFDWMIIYCLCGEDLFMMDVQIQSFLRNLYGDTKGI